MYIEMTNFAIPTFLLQFVLIIGIVGLAWLAIVVIGSLIYWFNT